MQIQHNSIGLNRQPLCAYPQHTYYFQLQLSTIRLAHILKHIWNASQKRGASVCGLVTGSAKSVRSDRPSSQTSFKVTEARHEATLSARRKQAVHSSHAHASTFFHIIPRIRCKRRRATKRDEPPRCPMLDVLHRREARGAEIWRKSWPFSQVIKHLYSLPPLRLTSFLRFFFIFMN